MIITITTLFFFTQKVFEGLKIVWTTAVFVMCYVLSLWPTVSYGLLFYFIHSFVLPKTTIEKEICRIFQDILKNCVFSARTQTIKISIGNICDVQIIKGDNYLQIIKADLQDNQALYRCVYFRGWSPGYVHCSASLALEIERGTAFDLKKNLSINDPQFWAVSSCNRCVHI